MKRIIDNYGDRRKILIDGQYIEIEYVPDDKIDNESACSKCILNGHPECPRVECSSTMREDSKGGYYVEVKHNSSGKND